MVFVLAWVAFVQIVGLGAAAAADADELDTGGKLRLALLVATPLALLGILFFWRLRRRLQEAAPT